MKRICKRHKSLIALFLVLMVCSGCASVSEGETNEPTGIEESVVIAESTRQMKFETNVVSFEIDPSDGSPCYDAIVEVKNTGDVAINLGWTPFSVTDSENKLIATENSSMIYAQPSVVYPGEVGYYFAARVELPEDIDTSASYNLVYDTDSIRVADTEGVSDYEVINISFPDDDYINIIGEVVNGSDTGDVDVLCICYDESGEITTIGGTMMEMATNHNTYFEIINYAAWGKNVADYKVIARTRSYN